ncbi:hypothetical protein [Polaribacter staleyi]|uniref:hypothetical protein n=1 Tax=Polaribacter staleyi TaxID=2022337 RepID=UPI0031BBAF1D
MEKENIEKWKNEVYKYLNSINQKLLKSEKSKELYYGFEVIDGKIIEKPEFLFIGINPGAGNGEKNYKIKLETERISYLDHFDYYYKYALAKQTVELLKLSGFSESEVISKLENNCVKTNLYHIITRQASEIKKCINQSEVSFKDYFNESCKFCISLIKITKPKIVILEGKDVFNQIIENCYEKYNQWNNELNIGYYFSESENIHFLSYKRIFSNILEKENLAVKLKQIIKNK